MSETTNKKKATAKSKPKATPRDEEVQRAYNGDPVKLEVSGQKINVQHLSFADMMLIAPQMAESSSQAERVAMEGRKQYLIESGKAKDATEASNMLAQAIYDTQNGSPEKRVAAAALMMEAEVAKVAALVVQQCAQDMAFTVDVVERMTGLTADEFNALPGFDSMDLATACFERLDVARVMRFFQARMIR